jgi:hypothetical protein
MYFNVDRIAVLAGLDRSGSTGLMREGAKPMPGGAPVAATKSPAPPAPAAPKAAAPAPKAAPPAPAKAAAGKPPMAEKDDELDEMYDEGAYEEGMYEDDMEDGAMESMYMDDMGLGGMGGMGDEEMYMDEMGHGHDHAKETVYEIDEMQLMEALVDMREQRLEEGKFRSKVRREISDVLNEMETGSRWIYGNKKPSNSGKGSVAKGFLGPGFR